MNNKTILKMNNKTILKKLYEAPISNGSKIGLLDTFGFENTKEYKTLCEEFNEKCKRENNRFINLLLSRW